VNPVSGLCVFFAMDETGFRATLEA